MKKTDIILIVAMVLIGLAFLLWSNQAEANSVICSGIVYTETSSIEVNLGDTNIVKVKALKFPGTWINIFPWEMSERGNRSFSYITHQCLFFVNDEVDSIENLRLVQKLLSKRQE